ncbi:tyrosine/serine/threonine protein phosphatase [Coemansia interrupta]|uniref:protein-tyrosine-phosphatase n=1 Tax=Coemansia interrupta TaxID=1126814 RepID=A0A9W8H6E9_9FUNG|nr:tyrosine/serine/threonine protein phosphatase [Coemansia interrupta]
MAGTSGRQMHLQRAATAPSAGGIMHNGAAAVDLSTGTGHKHGQMQHQQQQQQMAGPLAAPLSLAMPRSMPLPLRQLPLRRNSQMAPLTRTRPGIAVNTGAAGLALNLDMSGVRQQSSSSNGTSSVHRDPVCTPYIGGPPMGQDAALARRAARTYKNGPQQIMPYLYLGGADNVEGWQLRQAGIQRVLNVAQEPTSWTGASVEYRHIAWDHNESDVERHFGTCFAYIDAARRQHEGVFVHCQLGVSRSASLVIAYVMRTMAMGFEQAYEYVRVRAPCISPNLSLIAQLSSYGRRLADEEEVPELCESESASSVSSENSSPMEMAAGAGVGAEGKGDGSPLSLVPVLRYV